MAKATMREMGRRLGVSAVTISKALAGKPGVSDEMRQRILRLAEEVGYVNPLAPRSLQRRLDVGVLVPEKFFAPDTFYAMFIKRMLQTLADAGHSGLMELITPEMEDEMALPALLRSGRVEGLILLGQPERRYTQMLSSRQLPVIELDFHYPDLELDAVVSDGTSGAEELTGYLLSRGHREIGFVGNVKATSSIMARYLGFVSAMTRCGLPMHPEWMLSDRDDHNIARPIELPKTLPTAFVCNCDVTAQALVEALRHRGLRVPEDVSVVGYDDFVPQPGLLPLTTYQVDVEEMCRQALRLLEQRRAGLDTPPCRITVGGETLCRDSVGDGPKTANPPGEKE